MRSRAPADDGPALQMLGIARRAGELVIGSEAVERAARSGELRLAVIARDAGENARGRVLPALEQGGVPVAECGSRDELGRALGRPPTVAVGLTDTGMARAVRERIPGD